MRARILLVLVLAGLILIAPEFVFSQGNTEVIKALKDLKQKTGDKIKVEWCSGRVGTLEAKEGSLSAPYSGPPEEAAKQFLKENAAIFQMDPNLTDIELKDIKESLTGYHLSFKQTYKGLPIFNGGFGLYLKKDKSVDTVHSAYLPSINIATTPTLAKKDAIEIVKKDYIKNCNYYMDKTWGPRSCKGMTITFKENPYIQMGILEHSGKPYLIYMINIAIEAPFYNSLEYQIDANTGTILKGGSLLVYFSGTGKVFDPNPVNTLNNTGLQDNKDRDDSVFNGAYFTKTLNDMTFNNGNYYLTGPYVDVTDSIEKPFNFKKTSGYISSSSGNFDFTRELDEFEHVMVYYHIDTNQRYIQSLGFTNINNRPIKVDPHGLCCPAQDNSYYNPIPFGAGYLSFGDGGVDDAEDADIILHEYGHSIMDNQAPGKYVFVGSCSTEAGAMGEGFGDYWAASNTYSQSITNGFDPACIGEWDAAPNCLRRVDSTKHYPDSMAGECHADGEIWSGALWDMFNTLGKTVTDKLILQSHFFINDLRYHPTFCDGAKAILKADEQVYAGANKNTVTNIMTNRGIVGNYLIRVGSLNLKSSEDDLRAAVIDTTNGFAYLGTFTSPGKIVKIRLSDFTEVDTITLAAGENYVHSNTALIDTTNGYAYFTTGDAPNADRIVKIRLSDFTEVGSIILPTVNGSNLSGISSSVIDSTNDFAYFGISCPFGLIVKIKLSDFTVADILGDSPDYGFFNNGESFFSSAVIDSVNGFAYFGTNTPTGKIVRIRLSDFTRVDSITLPDGERYLGAATIDTINGFAYFAAYVDPPIIIKISLSDFNRVDSLIVNGEGSFLSAVIDATQGFAYFGTNSFPGNVVKISLTDFKKVGSLTLATVEGYLGSAVIDTVNRFAYFGTATTPGSVVKVSLGCSY